MGASAWRRQIPYPLLAATLALAALGVSTCGAVAVGAMRSPRLRAPASSPTATLALPLRTAPPAGAHPVGGPDARGAPSTPRIGRSHDRTPEQAAVGFAVAYLTFRWDDGADSLRRRCRPWDTDEVDAALAQPGVPSDRDRRVGAHETDDVEVHAVVPQDRAADHLDASVVALVTIGGPGRTRHILTVVVDLRVTATPGGWAVSDVTQ